MSRERANHFKFLHHNYILGECVNEMFVTLHVSTSTDIKHKTSSFMCTQNMNDT